MRRFNDIYNENCLTTMSHLPDHSVDVVITSPPYNMNLRIRNGQYTSRQIVKELSTKYAGFDDNLPIDEYYELHRSILAEALRIGKVVFYNIAIVTGSKRAWFTLMGEFADQLKEIIVWDKGHGQPAIQKQVLNRRTELLLVFDSENAVSRQFKDAQFERGTLADIWQIKRATNTNKEIYHGATFPEELVETIITNFCKEGGVVYDPFLGTGTTCVVAQRMNRQFIGSEINNDYFDLSLQRIKGDELNE